MQSGDSAPRQGDWGPICPLSPQLAHRVEVQLQESEAKKIKGYHLPPQPSVYKVRVSLSERWAIVLDPSFRAVTWRFCQGEDIGYENGELCGSPRGAEFIHNGVWGGSNLRMLSKTRRLVVRMEKSGSFTRVAVETLN